MKLGVIGAGNMGRAILSGILASGLITKDDIVASNRTEADRDKTEKLGVNVTGDNTDVARAECVILAVKPAKLADVIHEIAPVVGTDTLIVSVQPASRSPSLNRFLESLCRWSARCLIHRRSSVRG